MLQLSQTRFVVGVQDVVAKRPVLHVVHGLQSSFPDVVLYFSLRHVEHTRSLVCDGGSDSSMPAEHVAMGLQVTSVVDVFGMLIYC